MAQSSESSVMQLVSGTSQAIDELLAEQGLTGAVHAKIVAGLALYGAFRISYNLYSYSKTLAKCIVATR